MGALIGHCHMSLPINLATGNSIDKGHDTAWNVSKMRHALFLCRCPPLDWFREKPAWYPADNNQKLFKTPKLCFATLCLLIKETVLIKETFQHQYAPLGAVLVVFLWNSQRNTSKTAPGGVFWCCLSVYLRGWHRVRRAGGVQEKRHEQALAAYMQRTPTIYKTK